MSDDLRPKGCVEVFCEQCKGDDGSQWAFWVDCLDPRLPDGPFICDDCLGIVREKSDE